MDIDGEIRHNENLDSIWQEMAKRELGESAELIETSIMKLRGILFMNPEGICQFTRSDDMFLIRFLRAKKFDVEKSAKMIVKYMQMKRECPELFRVSPIEDLQSLLEMQMQWMLPQKDASGRQVYIFRVEKCDPAKCPVEKVFRTNVLSLEQAIRDPQVQIGGLVVVLDMAGLSFGHARFLSAHLSKRTVEVIQEAFPMRFKAFHVLHEPFYMDAILSVLKPFLKEKIRNRIHLHGRNLESLHRHIPKESLPIEYGGTQPDFDNSAWVQKILGDSEYYRELEGANN